MALRKLNKSGLTEPAYPVQIFSVNRKYGTDNPYTLSDLHKIVANFNDYQSRNAAGWTRPALAYLPKPDVGIGHEAQQRLTRELLGQTDNLSAGEVKGLFVSGLDLFAELTNVPEPVAALCDTKQLRTVSAEIYRNYIGPYGLRFGPVLGRVSLLGSVPPRLKGMRPIPPFRSLEPATHGRPAQSVTVFCETYTMTREEALSIIEAACPGYTPGPDVPDAWLILLAGKIKEAAPAIVPDAGGGSVGATPEGSGMSPMTPELFADRVFANISQRVANQIATAQAPVLQSIREMSTTFGGIVQNTERQACETFAEQNLSRLYPFETDPTNKSYIVTRLLRLPAEARAAEMTAIKDRPQVRTNFSETIPGRGDEHGEHGRIVGGGDTSVVDPERLKRLKALSPIGRGIANRELARSVSRN